MFRYIPIAVVLVAALAGCTLSGDTAETPTPEVTETPTPTATATPQNDSGEAGTTPNVSSLDNAPEPSTPPPTTDSDGDGVPDRSDYAPHDPAVQSKSDTAPETVTVTVTQTPTPTPTPETIRVDDPAFEVEEYGPRYPNGGYELDVEITNPHECPLTARASVVALFSDDSATGDRQEDLLVDERPWVQQTVESDETWRIDGVSYTGPNEVVDHDVDVEVLELMTAAEDHVECER